MFTNAMVLYNPNVCTIQMFVQSNNLYKYHQVYNIIVMYNTIILYNMIVLYNPKVCTNHNHVKNLDIYTYQDFDLYKSFWLEGKIDYDYSNYFITSITSLGHFDLTI